MSNRDSIAERELDGVSRWFFRNHQMPWLIAGLILGCVIAGLIGFWLGGAYLRSELDSTNAKLASVVSTAETQKQQASGTVSSQQALITKLEVTVTSHAPIDNAMGTIVIVVDAVKGRLPTATPTSPATATAIATQVPIPTATEIPISADAATTKINEGSQSITAEATDNLIIRTGPGTNYPEIRPGLAEGQVVKLIAISPDHLWFLHERGWTAAAFLRTNGDLFQLPVRQPPPTPTPTS